MGKKHLPIKGMQYFILGHKKKPSKWESLSLVGQPRRLNTALTQG